MWYAEVQVTDLSSVVHDISPGVLESGDALKLNLENAAADDFTFTIEDYDGTIRTWLERGCIVEVFIDTFKPPTTRRFYGMVEELSETWPLPSTVVVVVSGRDTFHIYLDRKVTETYLNTEVSAIVRDLMKKYILYPSDTVLAMSLYEGSGTTAHDESKYENDGTLLPVGAEPTWVDGKYGKALNFNGSTQYVSIADADILDTIVCFEAWINPVAYVSSATAYHIIATKNSTFRHGMLIRYNVNPNQFVAYFFDGTESAVFYSIPDYTDWYHVVAQWNSTTGKSELYVNGALVGEGVVITGTTGSNSEPVRIGGGVVNRYSAVIVDEVRCYSRILTAVEVKAHYDQSYLHNIDVTTETPDDLRFPYRSLKEVLDYLGSLSNFSYRGNTNNVITWKVAASEDSGVVYDQSDLSSGAEKLETLFTLKNRVYVLGGYYYEVDQEQLTHDAAKNTKDKWYAQSFTPAKPDLDQISLYLKRTLDPSDLQVEIRTDSSGPSQKVATLSIDKDLVETAAGWIPAQLDATLLIGEKYWIILQLVGDVTNYYEWYEDNLAAGENADSDDGVSWSVNASSYEFAFKTHYKVPVLAVKQDYTSGGNYMWREYVHRDEAIVSRDVARSTAQALLDEYSDETPSVKNLETANQAVIPDRGKLVTLTLTPLGITAVQYVAQTVSFNFPGGEDGTVFMDVILGKSAEELAEWLNRLRLDIDRTKIGNFGVEEGLVNIIQSVGPDAVTAGDDVDTTECPSGDFKIEAACIAYIGFSDVG